MRGSFVGKLIPPLHVGVDDVWRLSWCAQMKYYVLRKYFITLIFASSLLARAGVARKSALVSSLVSYWPAIMLVVI